MIIVWGVDHGKCLPAAGVGFRREFSNSNDADLFIQSQCTAVSFREIHHYAIYITDEYCSLDRLMHYHNWSDTDHSFRDVDLKVEKVNMMEIKERIDLQYMALQKQTANAKMRIDESIKNMSSEEYAKQKRLFTEAMGQNNR